jgi:hypothetical protein
VNPHLDTGGQTQRRIIWSIYYFGVVAAGCNEWASWGQWAGFSWAAPLIVLLGLLGLTLTWLDYAWWHDHLNPIGISSALLSVGVAGFGIIHGSQYFMTDSAAFNQRASSLLLQGINPYTAHFNPAHLALSNASNFWTYTLNGGHIDQLSYPAGSFLLQAPFQWLGFTHLTSDYLDLAAWLVTGLVLYFAITPKYRWIAPMLLMTSIFTYIFTHGGTDALFVPFLAVAAWRTAIFSDGQAPRWQRWIGPLALGVACSIKQTPWFAAPLLLLVVLTEARDLENSTWKIGAQYVALAAFPFVLLNIPFIIWNAKAWWHGVLIPLTQPLLPDGQGLISVVQHGLLTSVTPNWLSLVGFGILLLIACAMWAKPAQWSRAWLFALPLVLFVAARSLTAYYIDFLPAAIITALTLRQLQPPLNRSTVGVRILRGLGACFIVLGLVLAFVPANLSLQVRGYSVEAGGQQINNLKLTFTNASAHPVEPHVLFLVSGSHPVGFWTTPNPIVPANSSVTLTYVSPSPVWLFSKGTNWLVEATTTGPNIVVVSNTKTWKWSPH